MKESTLFCKKPRDRGRGSRPTSAAGSYPSCLRPVSYREILGEELIEQAPRILDEQSALTRCDARLLHPTPI